MPLLNDEIERAEREFNIGKGDDRFKPEEGDNRIRILSRFAAIQNNYEGKPSTKFMCWIWVAKLKALKLYFAPYSVAKAIGELEVKPDYAFTELPMPYDVILTKTKSGPETRDVKYSVLAARTNTPVPPEALVALKAQKPIEEVRDTVQKNQSEEAPTTTPSQTEVNVEDTLGAGKAAPDFLK